MVDEGVEGDLELLEGVVRLEEVEVLQEVDLEEEVEEIEDVVASLEVEIVVGGEASAAAVVASAVEVAGIKKSCHLSGLYGVLWYLNGVCGNMAPVLVPLGMACCHVWLLQMIPVLTHK